MMRPSSLRTAASKDLDQAFSIERSGTDLLLHYAIADVGWFVDDGGIIDAEAWRRGTTLYLPDGKAGLYPPSLSEGAASLLPDGPRPAVVFTVRVAEDGAVRLDAAERAIILSRAKLAYDNVAAADLPPDFAELARRIENAETRRGAARVDPPEQEVEPLGDGRYALRFRPRYPAETRNASLSLATNMAIADATRSPAPPAVRSRSQTPRRRGARRSQRHAPSSVAHQPAPRCGRVVCSAPASAESPPAQAPRGCPRASAMSVGSPLCRRRAR